MSTVLPTGVVTFLLTDVEGSTRLWEEDRKGMAASLAVHDGILRVAATDNRGHVFSTSGDAFAIAFASAGDAIGAAIAIQLALQEATWPGPAIAVRIGIHEGIADERDGDYYGPVVNRTARIMAAGHGGHILMSAAVAGPPRVDEAVSFHDLGTHHLKDLDEPQHLFEARHHDLSVVATPIRTVDVRLSNLPKA